ncbi:UNVERIFIED_CONTAM: hypothetical protein K2H54_016879 [Gekko kuhli]
MFSSSLGFSSEKRPVFLSPYEVTKHEFSNCFCGGVDSFFGFWQRRLSTHLYDFLNNCVTSLLFCKHILGKQKKAHFPPARCPYTAQSLPLCNCGCRPFDFQLLCL